ncbi:MAG: hypothetical protein WC606_01875 [Candidatus Absconditabacterales bacterium]|jgi:hypothetical protein
MTTKEITTIAISVKDFEEFGCPGCGGIFGYSSMSGGGAAVWHCECELTTVILADDITISPVSINDVRPVLQEHPRKGIPIDRKKLIKERTDNISLDEIDHLTKWMRLAYGENVKIKKVGSHSSKSRHLPIISAIPKSESNVKVTWFAQNYHFHFLGVKLQAPVYATLMYPIINMFGGYALSGHVNTKIAPAITNFMKHYHNQELLQNFGMDCGDGYFSALTTRYLHEVSKLDKETIMDICLRKSNYGKVDNIHGNSVDLEKLIKAIGLKGEQGYCEFDVSPDKEGIFSKIKIHEFCSAVPVGGSSIEVTLKKDALLPALTLPSSNVYVKASDTILGKHITGEIKDGKEKLVDSFVPLIPTSFIKYKEGTKENQMKLRKCPYPTHRCYWDENLETRDFIINIPNPLDATLVALYLTKVIDPIVAAMSFEA